MVLSRAAGGRPAAGRSPFRRPLDGAPPSSARSPALLPPRAAWPRCTANAGPAVRRSRRRGCAACARRPPMPHPRQPRRRIGEHVVVDVQVDDQDEVVGRAARWAPHADVVHDPVDGGLAGSRPRPLDADGREVDRRHLPSTPGQPDRMTAFASAEVERPPGRHRPDDPSDRGVRRDRPERVVSGVAIVPAGDVVTRRSGAAVALLVLAGHNPSVPGGDDDP